MSFLVFFFAVFKNVIYGLTVPLVGDLSKNTDVLDLLALRYIVSFAFMFFLKLVGIVKINVKLKELFKKGDVRNVFLAGLFEPCLYMFFENIGISLTTGITAGVILSLAPAVNIFIESWILKERARLLKKFLLILGVIGAVYIALMSGSGEETGKDSFMGIAALFMALLSGGCFLCFSRKSSKSHSAMEITYISAFMGMVTFNGINIVRHLINGTIITYFNPFLNVENICGFVFLGIISTVIATAMNNYALGKIHVTTMSAFSGISTLVTVLVGVFIGGENIYYYHYIGFTLILVRMIGVSCLDIREKKVR